MPLLMALAVLAAAGVQGSAAPDSGQSRYVVVYGIRTVTPTLSPAEARARGLPFGDVPKVSVTRLFTVDPSNGQQTLVFSDRTLPIMVLWATGATESTIYGSVVTAPARRMAIALAASRTAPRAPLLYQLSLDGSNAVRRVSDVEGMTRPAVSPDGSQVAYFVYRPQRILIRSTSSGAITKEIPLGTGEYADEPRLSWSPDGSALLVPRWPGPDSETVYNLVHVRDGRIQATALKGDIYSLLPRSGRLLAVRLTYDKSEASPVRQFFSMDPDGRDTLTLPLPPCRGSWYGEVSPDEALIAYPCGDQTVVIGALAGGAGSRPERAIPVGTGNVIGWIAR